MAINDLSFNQASTLLNSIVSQATGQTALVATDTASFVTQAQTALKMGYDPILNAINQVMNSSIISVRPYDRKLKGLEKSATQWGNWVRKIKIVDLPMTDDQRYLYPVAFDSSQTPATGDGKSVDMYVIRKPNVLQTNFYGSNVYQDYITRFKDQLDCAFSSPAELSAFASGIMTEITNKREQYREGIARATLANFIGGLIAEMMRTECATS